MEGQPDRSSLSERHHYTAEDSAANQFRTVSGVPRPAFTRIAAMSAPGDHHNRMAVAAQFLVCLVAEIRGRHQDSELPVTQARDQPR